MVDLFFSGERKARLCALVQYVLLYGVCVAYTITTSVSIRLVSWYCEFIHFRISNYDLPKLITSGSYLLYRATHSEFIHLIFSLWYYCCRCNIKRVIKLIRSYINIAEQLANRIVTTEMGTSFHAMRQILPTLFSMELYKLSCVKYRTFINYGVSQYLQR